MPVPLAVAASKVSQPAADDVDLASPRATGGHGGSGAGSSKAAHNKLVLRTDDGLVTEVDSLAVPDSVKRLLAELDLDGSGEVSERDLRDSLQIIKHMKAGLDVDGSGGITNEEMDAGVKLLTKLMQEKKGNMPEMEYTHLPECIQAVMKEWDADGSGKVGAAELAAAAQAYKKVQQEGRLMRKIILAMAIVILVLMGSMFVLSYAAVDMAKEMRGNKEGVMNTPDGTVVKVANSEFELRPDGSMVIRGTPQNASCPVGQTCRRLGEASGAGSLKVASAETKRRLSSTLPDTAFKELKSLTLSDAAGHALKVSISSFQRLSLRSSHCGSVVHLLCDQGRLTLDDYEMMADAQLEAYAKDAGMAGLFASGPVSGFGRRLSSTDGMLEGFFNLLDDVEWTCESVELPSPDAMPQFYHAKIRVRHQHENPASAYSALFHDLEGNPLPLAGVEMDGDRVYKTWTEDLVKVGSITAYMSQFAMNPLMREVRVKRGTTQLRIEAMDSVGYRCRAEDAGQSTMAATANAATGATMEFIGVVVEGGVVLRQWRMYTVNLEDEDPQDPRAKAMAEAGMIPNVVDYFDVDTDPSGSFQPGQPYRIRMYSTVAGARIDTEKQYVSITSLPVAFEMQGVLDRFGVTRLDTACAPSREAANNQGAKDLAGDTSYLQVTQRSLTDPAFEMPPELQSFTEMGDTVRYIYDNLKQASKSEPKWPALLAAKTSTYWSMVLKYSHNWDVIDSFRIDPEDYEFGNVTRPVGGRRLGIVTPGENEDEYHVLITPQDYANPRGLLHPSHESRRLAEARRLGDYEFEAMVTPEYINIGVKIGKASMSFKCHYCHLVTPTLTSWGACKTGRKTAGQIVKVEAAASGKQILFPFPTVTAELGGKLEFDDTAALGCTKGSKIFLRSVGARGKYLEDNMGTLRLNFSANATQKFTLIDASGGSTSNIDVWVQTARGQYLQDSSGTIKVVAQNTAAEKFRILDAGNGKLYLRSLNGMYLGVKETGAVPVAKNCTVTIYKSTDCKGTSKTYQSNSTSGQEFKFSDDVWRSANSTGDCFQVEFYDEDKNQANYDDNIWKSDTFACFNFVSDLDEDMSGLRLFAKKPILPEFIGNIVLVPESQLGNASQWELLNDDAGKTAACSFGDPMLVGVLTFKKEIAIIWDIKASFTTELGAAYSKHQTYGGYISEVYGKGIAEFGMVSIYLLIKMNPIQPWFRKYKDWTLCLQVGYEIDAWAYVYRDEFTLFCQDLFF